MIPGEHLVEQCRERLFTQGAMELDLGVQDPAILTVQGRSPDYPYPKP